MLRIVLLLPFLAVLVAFALSNTQPVQLRIWPLDFLSLEVPLSLAMLAGCALFFFLGALFVWFGSVAARGRAARAERRAAALEKELKIRAAPVAPSRPVNRNAVPALAAPK
jgi:uncharacterized integral membrane protein